MHSYVRGEKPIAYPTVIFVATFISLVGSCTRSLRSEIPSPPIFFGQVTLGHATRQWPPFASFLSLHKYPRRILSIAIVDQGPWPDR
jgi:hypothetical protein